MSACSRRRFRSIAFALLVSITSSQAIAADAPGDVVGRFLDEVNLDRGIVSLVTLGDGHLATTVAELGEFMVHGWEPDAARAQAARERAVADHRHGRTITIERGDLERLPYADNTVDIIIAAHLTKAQLQRLRAEEVLRCLRPRGSAFVGSFETRGSNYVDAAALNAWLKRGEQDDTVARVTPSDGTWVKLTKAPLEGADDWSHWEHGPDNNPVSNDAIAKAPYMTQWLGRPYYIAMPAVTTAAGGRIFIAMGHIAHHEREEPWLNTLMARNGYNGTILWRRKLPDGYLVHRSAFIATAQTFYMIDMDGSGCLLLDPETGDEKGRIRMRAARGQWKWMALKDGILYALIGAQKDPPQTTIVRSSMSHWSWAELSKGYYSQQVPWGFGKTLVAYDVAAESVVWKHVETAPIDSRSMTIGSDSVYLYAPGSRAVALDVKSGAPRWENRDASVTTLIEESGRGLSSTPGFRTMNFCLYTPEALVFQAQTRMNVVALSPATGKLLWHRPKTSSNPNALYVGEQLVVGIGENGENLMVDAKTGKTLASLKFSKRACARLTATADSLFCRGWPDGLTRFDRYTKEVQANGAVRPSCNDGVIAANGLLYMGPWLCDCNLTLMGRVVMCAAGDFDFDGAHRRTPALEVAATELNAAPLEVTPADWSSHRANAARSGSSPVTLDETLSWVWDRAPAAADSFVPTTMTSTGNLLLIGGDDGSVRAFETVMGNEAWRFHTAGRIMQPPTVWEGRAFVGSGDGYVYALEVRTGKLLWRFRAAPAERRIPVYGHLSSTWPVHGGVLVADGVAYFAAGIIDYDSTHVYAVDARSGKLLWHNGSTGHLDPKLRKGVSAQGNLTLAGGRLWLAAGNVCSPAAFDLASGRYVGKSAGDGAPQTNRGEEIAVFKNRHVILGGRLRFSATKNVVNPGFFETHALTDTGSKNPVHLASGKIPPVWNDDYFVAVDGRLEPAVCYRTSEVERAFDAGERLRTLTPVWSAEALKEKNIVSLALTVKDLLVVFEEKQARSLATKWHIAAFALEDGTEKWRQGLDKPAATGALLVDRSGRVVVAFQDGGLVCFGPRAAFDAIVDDISKRAKSDTDLAWRKSAIGQLEKLLDTAADGDLTVEVLKRLKEFGVDPTAAGRRHGAVTIWRTTGPVPWTEDAPADHVFVGEPYVDVHRATEFGGRQLNWNLRVSTDRYGMVDLAPRYGRLGQAAVYAHAEIVLPKAQRMVMRLGSNDGFKVWFNGQEIGKLESGRGYIPDSDAFEVEGRAGANEVLIKVLNLGNLWSYGVRFTDAEKNPIAFEQTLSLESP